MTAATIQAATTQARGLTRRKLGLLRRERRDFLVADPGWPRALAGERHPSHDPQIPPDAFVKKAGTASASCAVREALRLLEAEGLVEFHPNRGAVVSTVTAEEVADIYAIRAALECAAFAHSAPLLTVPDLDLAASILDEIDEETEVAKFGELNR